MPEEDADLVARERPDAPPPSETPTASRSTSGSFASTRRALVRLPRAKARSIVPFSSGLGEATVGNEPSGCSCSGTLVTRKKPASDSAARTKRLPQP